MTPQTHHHDPHLVLDAKGRVLGRAPNAREARRQMLELISAGVGAHRIEPVAAITPDVWGWVILVGIIGAVAAIAFL